MQKTQYWVGDFLVDLSRNQVTHDGQSVTLAPKALAVLTHLANHAKKVISHDELLSQVWQGTVVTPNTLQKSIAQLRKVFSDFGKNNCIKTHTKQGYSLECEVIWQSNDDVATNNTDDKDAAETDAINSAVALNEIEQKPTKQAPDDITTQIPNFKIMLLLIALLIGGTILGISAIKFIPDESTSTLSFNKLRSITATKDKEFEGSYTPDGQYVLFNRYLDKQCTNRIWAKDVNTHEEILLTSEWGTYGRHTLSADGNRLVFIETTDCRTPSHESKCYNLMSLNFKQALKSPQSPDLLVQCRDSKIQKPIWLDDNQVAVLRHYANRWQLISYSTSANESQMLYDIDEGSIVDYTFASDEKLIAVTSVHSDGQHYIDLLDIDGELISSNLIQYPETLSKFRFIHPDFTPEADRLVFTSGRQLFFLDFDGSVTKINIPIGEWVSAPDFHPDGDKLLLVKGPYDSDIATISLTNTENSSSYSTIESSTLGEENAHFQPNGDLIAFISERSGENQLWLTDGKTTKQLSNFPVDSFFRGYEWATDGQSLLVNNNYMLSQIFLDGTIKNVNLDLPVLRLYHWNSRDNSALATLYERGKHRFVELNVATGQSIDLREKTISWAQKTQAGQLIYTDEKGQFWQPGPVDDQLIEPLLDQNVGRRFNVQGNVIYGVNGESQLWSFNTEDNTFNIIRTMPDNLDHITDINQTHALIEVKISAKKELIEYSIDD